MLIAGNYSRSNNIVTDHDTGLQWQDTPYTAAEKAVYNSRTQEHGRVTKWVNAAAVCSNAGNGWRLATIQELFTLVDRNYYNPAMDPIFQSGIGLGFWSSTLSTTVGGSAQGIGFEGGYIHNCGMSGPAKFIRCVRTGGSTTPPPPPPAGDNVPPTADAGPDKTVQVNTPATIIGSGSDSDGAIVSYQWTRKSDGSVWSNDEVLVFTPSGLRPKTFVLTVTDDEGAKGTDEMILTVSKDPVDDTPPPPSTGNTPPTADAGPDRTVQVNTPVTIVGKASDSDGSIVAYEWKKQSNGQILSRSATLNFTPTGTRTKTLVFTVTDDQGAKASDSMILTVTR